MRPDPEPRQTVWSFNGDGSMVQTNARRPEPVDFLEVERQMLGVTLEKGKGLIREFLNFLGQCSVGRPEVWGGVVIQNFVD